MLHPSPSIGFLQFSDKAKARAVVVFPVPRIPANRYAEAILSLAIILFKKAIAFSWPIISSSNVRLMGTLVSVVFFVFIVFVVFTYNFSSL